MLLSNDFDRTNPLGFGLTQVENALDGLPTSPVPTNPEGTGLETMLQEIIDKIEAGGGEDSKVVFFNYDDAITTYANIKTKADAGFVVGLKDTTTSSGNTIVSSLVLASATKIVFGAIAESTIYIYVIGSDDSKNLYRYYIASTISSTSPINEIPTAKAVYDFVSSQGGGGNVDDVQINGTSILDENKVANIPLANGSTPGALSGSSSTYGYAIANGILQGYVRQIANYNTDSNSMLISKGTLENVLSAKVTLVATYGTTTFDDIKAAHDANRQVILIYNDYVGMLTKCTSSIIEFEVKANNFNKILSVNSSNTWSVTDKAEVITFTTSGGQVITKSFVLA